MATAQFARVFSCDEDRRLISDNIYANNPEGDREWSYDTRGNITHFPSSGEAWARAYDEDSRWRGYGSMDALTCGSCFVYDHQVGNQTCGSPTHFALLVFRPRCRQGWRRRRRTMQLHYREDPMAMEHICLYLLLLLLGLAPALDQGAAPPPESRLGMLNVPDAKGWLRLHEAVLHSTRGQVAALLEAGADANMGCADGTYPLMLAAYRGDPAIVTLLLEKGAAPVMPGPDNTDLSALHIAAARGHARAWHKPAQRVTIP